MHSNKRTPVFGFLCDGQFILATKPIKLKMVLKLRYIFVASRACFVTRSNKETKNLGERIYNLAALNTVIN